MRLCDGLLFGSPLINNNTRNYDVFLTLIPSSGGSRQLHGGTGVPRGSEIGMSSVRGDVPKNVPLPNAHELET